MRQRNRAEKVSEVLTQTFEIPDPDRSRGVEVTARELLDAAVQKLDHSLVDQPEVKADLLLTIGRTYRNLGLVPEALDLARRALATRERLLGLEHREVAEALDELAEVALVEARFREAEEAARRSLAIHQALGLPRDSARLVRLARALEFQGRYDDAAALYTEALALARNTRDAEKLAAVLERAAFLERKRDRSEEAESLLREALDVERRELGADHPTVVQTLNELGLVLLWRGRLGEAEGALQEAQGLEGTLYREAHPRSALTLNHLGLLRIEQGRLPEAEDLFRQSIAVARKAYGGDHPAVAATLLNLGNLLQQLRRSAEAETTLSEAVAILRRLVPAGHPELAQGLVSLANFHIPHGRYAEAEGLYREALEILKNALGERHSQVGVNLGNLATLREHQGDLQGALELRREAVAIARESRARPQDLAGALHNLGALERSLGAFDRAAASYSEALALSLATFGEEHLNVAMSRLSLAELELTLGRPAHAEELASLALPVLARDFPAEDPWIKAANRILEKSRLAAQRQLLGSPPREP